MTLRLLLLDDTGRRHAQSPYVAPVPVVVAAGQAYVVPANVQLPWMLPVTLQDDARLVLDGEFVGVA